MPPGPRVVRCASTLRQRSAFRTRQPVARQACRCRVQPSITYWLSVCISKLPEECSKTWKIAYSSAL
eukprot:7274286-Karenia_brevis.AAC.1